MTRLPQRTRDHATRQLATAAAMVAVNPESAPRVGAAYSMIAACLEGILRADTERQEDEAYVATMRARGVETGPLEARLRLSIEARASLPTLDEVGNDNGRAEAAK